MAFDGTLKFDTKIDESGFTSGIEKLGSLAKEGMKVVAKAVSAATTAVAGLGGYAINVGEGFEKSMSQVIATMGITKETIQDGVNSYELLKEAAAAAGESTTFSASEAADALNYLALAGYDAAKAAQALPSVLDLAAAGGMDLAYASDLATDAMAALGIEATSENLTRFGDEMAKTASKANTSVSQLGEAILTVGGTAKSLAGGTSELNAALGVLANRGIKGSEGGTALRNMILALSAPTDKAAVTLKGLGVEAFDAEGNLRPLNDTFKDMDSALADMSEGEKTQVLNEIFNKVDLKSAQAMLAGCGEEFDALTSALAACDGAMADMAHTMNDTLEGDIKSLQSKAEAFGIAIYEDLNAPLRELVQLGGNYVSQLTAAFKEGSFEGLADKLGDVLGQAVTKIAEYIPTIAQMGTSVLTKFVDGIIENINIVSDAATRIVISLVDTVVQIIPQFYIAGTEILGTLAQGLASAVPQLLSSAVKGIKNLIIGINDNLPLIIEAGVQIIEAFTDTISDNLGGLVIVAFEAVQLVANALIENAPKLLNAALTIIHSVAVTILDSIPMIIEIAVQLTESIIDFLIDSIPVFLDAAVQLFMSLVNALPQIISALYKELPKLLDAVLKMFPQIVNAIAQAMPAIISAVTGAFPIIIDAVTLALPDMIESFIDALFSSSDQLLEASIQLFYALVDSLPIILEALIEQLPLIITAVITVLSEAAPELAEASLSLFMEIVKAIPLIITEVTKGIAQLGTSAAESIGKIFSDGLKIILEWLGNTLKTAKQGAADIVRGVMEFLNELPGMIGEMLGKALGTISKWCIEAPDKVKDAARRFIENVKIFFSQLPDNVGDFLDKVISKVTEWAKKLTEKGRNAAKDLVNTITDGISSLPQRMSDAGRDLVHGLWNGITGAGAWLRDRISDFGQGIIDGFKSAFGIHSPSTVMRDSVGKHIAEGVGVGFMSALPKLGEQAKDALTESLKMSHAEIGLDLAESQINIEDIPEVNGEIDISDIPEEPEPITTEDPETDIPESYSEYHDKAVYEPITFEIDIPDSPKTYFSPNDVLEKELLKEDTPKVIVPEIKMPEINISVPEPQKIDIPEIDIPEINIPEIDISEPEPQNIDIPKIEIPEIDIPEIKSTKNDAPEINISEPLKDIVSNAVNENNILGMSKLLNTVINRNEFSSELDKYSISVNNNSDFFDSGAYNAILGGIKNDNTTVITPDALKAIYDYSINSEHFDSTLSATSDISSNYDKVSNNTSSEISNLGNQQPMIINVEFVVGEEVVAEGVLDLIDGEIDERQGIRINMKKRGVAT